VKKPTPDLGKPTLPETVKPAALRTVVGAVIPLRAANNSEESFANQVSQGSSALKLLPLAPHNGRSGMGEMRSISFLEKDSTPPSGLFCAVHSNISLANHGLNIYLLESKKTYSDTGINV
jgi:hypothetical protein